MTSMDTGPTGIPSVEQLDMMPVPVCVRDENGRFVSINRRFESAFAVSSRDLVGRTPSEVFTI